MNKLQIQVLTRDGQKNIYETDRWRNVADLKRHIGRNMKVPMGFSRLTCNGRVLTNDSILDDYIQKDEGIKRLSTLELCWRPLVLTPKQYREKELELDKLEQKARKCCHKRTSSGVHWARDQVRIKPRPIVLAPQPQHKQRAVAKVEHHSTSSDESDFLAAYWCCSNIAIKPSRSILDASTANVHGDADAHVKADDCVKCDNDTCHLPESGDLSQDPYEARCLVCKQQMLRSEARLTAARMSRSIISHIKKNQKNCKK